MRGHVRVQQLIGAASLGVAFRVAVLIEISRPTRSGRVLRAVGIVLTSQVPVAAVEELEHLGHVGRPLDAVADEA